MKTDVISLDNDMAELSLLLPREQLLGLIDVAQSEGISVAHYLRRLVWQALDHQQVDRRFSRN